MRFVNMSSRPAYTKMSGHLLPGQTSSDGGPSRIQLEKTLSEIVKSCGDRLAIRLNEREADLLDKLVALDEKGSGFRRDSLPKEALEDPLGIKESEEREYESQKRKLDSVKEANEKHAKIEREINSEAVASKMLKAHEAPKGEKVEPSMLKSGFDKIMEENAKIASSKPKFDQMAALDPIGKNAKDKVEGKNGETAEEEKPVEADEEPVAPVKAENADENIASNADAAEPSFKPSDERNKMDRDAAEMAGSLSVLSVFSKKPSKGRGRPGKKAK